jgi:hypothetical protein
MADSKVESTKKRTRKPFYVLVPTEYKEEVVSPVDDESDVRVVRTPVGYRLLGRAETKKQIAEMLTSAGLDVTSGITDVLVLKGNPIPLKVSTQVLVRF